MEFYRRHGGLVLLGAALLAVLSGPFVARPKHRKLAANKTLIVITPHSDEIRTEFEWAFSEWTAERYGFTTRIDWLDVGGTNAAIRYVDGRYEKNPESAGIDVFFGGGVDPFLHLGRKGLLHRCNLPPEVLNPIPQTYGGMEVYDPEQRWFGACLAGFGIVYNKEVFRRMSLPPVMAWEDMGRPELFSWVVSGDPRLSGSIHMCYEIMFQAYGWERGWRNVLQMGANCRRFSREASGVPLDVAAGDAACGMAIDTYALHAVADAGPEHMGFLLPSGLTVVNPDGIAVLKGAPHQELAEMFVQFVLSERGQLLWILRKGTPGGPKRYQLYRLPVIPGLIQKRQSDAAVTFDPFAFESGVQFDPVKMSRRWRILNDLLGATILDTHDELVAAWNAVRDRPLGDPQVKALLEPPISEEELMNLASERWNDASFRSDTIARWSREAARRYRLIAEGK